MSTFKTLFKYELKKQFPISFKKEKKDIVGKILSFLVTSAIVVMFVYFLAIISKNYVNIKLDKSYDSLSRSYELLNLAYLVILGVMFVLCLENMRKTFMDNTDKNILLKLPVKEQTLFITKLLVLLIKNYILALLLVMPTNVIIYIALNPSFVYWITTFIVWLLFPIIVLLFTSLFIVPYIVTINFLKTKYILIFILFTIILGAFVLLYISFLGIVQGYLETGFIKFLFNEKFINTLKALLVWAYPTSSLASIMVGKYLLRSILVLVGVVLVAFVVVYFITKRLYHITLYRGGERKSFNKISKPKKSSPLMAFIKKEFISIAREPKHIFSYLVIATIMPILVYTSFTLFQSLIDNMLGVKISFTLALFIVIVFSVLTNTFCATNVTREGIAMLKQKTFPVKASNILLAKIIFCSAISMASVIVSILALIIFTSLTITSGLLCMLVGIMFTLSQILVATKLDLKNTNLSFTANQIERHSSTTIAKVVVIGLILSIATGLSSLMISITSEGSLFAKYTIHPVWAYLIPVLVGFIYTGLSIWFYLHKLQKSLDNITK